MRGEGAHRATAALSSPRRARRRPPDRSPSGTVARLAARSLPFSQHARRATARRHVEPRRRPPSGPDVAPQGAFPQAGGAQARIPARGRDLRRRLAGRAGPGSRSSSRPSQQSRPVTSTACWPARVSLSADPGTAAMHRPIRGITAPRVRCGPLSHRWGCHGGVRMCNGITVALPADTLDAAIGLAVALVKTAVGH